MKRFLPVIFYLCLCFFNAKAQTPCSDKSSGGVIDYWADTDVQKTKNAYYLNSDWAYFDLFLKSGCLVEGRLIRLNLLTNKFEVKFGSGIKVLDAKKVEYFEFNDNGIIRLFESTPGYEIVSKRENSFFEILVPGDLGLLSETFLEETASRSKPSKRKNPKWIKKSRFWLVNKGRYIEIPQNKKQFYSTFGDYQERTFEYTQTRKFDLTERKDLTALVKFLKAKV